MSIRNMTRCLSAVVVFALAVSTSFAAPWSIADPTDNQNYGRTSPVAGYGGAPEEPASFVFKIMQNVGGAPTVMSSQSGTSNGNAVEDWNATCEAPQNQFNAGAGTAVLTAEGSQQDSVPIQFANM